MIRDFESWSTLTGGKRAGSCGEYTARAYSYFGVGLHEDAFRRSP